MIIREANPSDCKYIASIYNQYLGKSTMDLEAKDSKFYEDFLRSKDAREELWVGILGNMIVGWGIIKLYSPKSGYRYTGETSVYFDKYQLRKGFGSTLKKHLMKRCKMLEYHNLLARIFASNHVSIDYNKKLGYRIVGKQKEAGFINGKWQDVVIMEVLL